MMTLDASPGYGLGEIRRLILLRRFWKALRSYYVSYMLAPQLRVRPRVRPNCYMLNSYRIAYLITYHITPYPMV